MLPDVPEFHRRVSLNPSFSASGSFSAKVSGKAIGNGPHAWVPGTSINSRLLLLVQANTTCYGHLGGEPVVGGSFSLPFLVPLFFKQINLNNNSSVSG